MHGPGFWVDVRDKPTFILAAMRLLAGGARISFEGNLVGLDLLSLPGVSGTETSVLPRQTLVPTQDFVVLPLEPENISHIAQITPPSRLVQDIEHIQIEKGGRLELGLYDNFDPDSSWAGEAFSPVFLNQLKAKGTLRDWRRAQ
jgi:hypothetical protein